MIALHHIRDICPVYFVPGNTPIHLISHVTKIAEHYKCQIVANVNSYNVHKDSVKHQTKIFSLRSSSENNSSAKKITFEDHECYCVDIMLTKGGDETKIPELTAVPNSETTLFKLKDYYNAGKLKQANILHTNLFKQHHRNTFHIRSVIEHSVIFTNSCQILKLVFQGGLVYQMKFMIIVKEHKGQIFTGKDIDFKKFKDLADVKGVPEEVSKFVHERRQSTAKAASANI
ncbi:MAG: Proliferation-associated protein 2G4 [Paramarteilia canceri]